MSTPAFVLFMEEEEERGNWLKRRASPKPAIKKWSAGRHLSSPRSFLILNLLPHTSTTTNPQSFLHIPATKNFSSHTRRPVLFDWNPSFSQPPKTYNRKSSQTPSSSSKRYLNRIDGFLGITLTTDKLAPWQRGLIRRMTNLNFFGGKNASASVTTAS